MSAAAHRGHPAPITLLLLNHADVNKCGDAGWSPLHAAAYGGKNEAVRLLMAKGANEYATETHGATPIDIAIRCENEKCIVLMGGEIPEGGFNPKSAVATGAGGADGAGGAGGADGADATETGFRVQSSSSSGSNGNEHGGTQEVTNPLITIDTQTTTTLKKKSSKNVRAAARRSSIRRTSPREGTGSADRARDNSSPSSGEGASASPVAAPATPKAPASSVLRVKGDFVRAMFDFQSESAGELELVAGNKYVVLEKESSSGWTYGRNDEGQKGLFPTQYVETVAS